MQPMQQEKVYDALTKVVVYGTLMRGQPYAKYLGDVKRTPCTIQGHLYDTFAGYPIFVPDPEGRTIKAELIEVDEELLNLLDQVEGYPTLYNRIPIEVSFSDSKHEEALVYTFATTTPLWMPEIRTDGWVEYAHALGYKGHYNARLCKRTLR